MCTVTFIARKKGYALGMNRDEKLTRAKGLPPKIFSSGVRQILCPTEPGGGTWIALNDAGAAFALINWYSVKAVVAGNSVSRGEVVKSVAAASSADASEKILTQLPLAHINPFRVLGFFPAEKKVVEWRWDLKRLAAVSHAWKTGVWISSGFDEPGAEHSRRKIFSRARRQKSAGSLDWLRHLHRSHAPARGPYCLCMHRADAATVSYTELSVSPRGGAMRYHSGSPCAAAKNFIQRLPFKTSRAQ
jgi:hypothetical protein